MTRQQKYPDTSTFHFYNANPHNKLAGDCVIRALCTALNQSWEQTLRELTEVGLKYGYVPNDKACYAKYLEKKGWKKYKQPKRDDNTKFTGKEFCQYLKKYSDGSFYPQSIKGNVIAHIGGHHTVAFVEESRGNYRLYDTWNSTEGCIGNYWVKD